MHPISRRQALLLGGLGAACTAAGGAGLIWTMAAPFEPVTGSGLTQPTEERSVDGSLRVRLEAAPGRILLAGRRAAAMGYNQAIPGPTLRLRAGDTLMIRLVNNLPQATNLHVHGLHVSPHANGDNVFLTVKPGASFDYEYELPQDHPPGVYWYHPHHHGTVADQIFSGLFGAIIVEDPQPLEVATERVLIVSDTTVDGQGNIPPVPPFDRMMGREGRLLLVNGQRAPRFTARPGERERWRIVNACVARNLRLRLDGQQLQLLGMDSDRYPGPKAVTELMLTPGNRADLLVTTVAGDTVLSTLPHDRGRMPEMMGRGTGVGEAAAGPDGTALATLHVSGAPATPLAAVPVRQGVADLRSSPAAAQRRITLDAGMAMGSEAGPGMGPGGGMMRFTLNGRRFNEARTDITAGAGTVEEWTLTNTGPMDHPFHLHVWPMQIIEADGRAMDGAVWRDVVNVPAHRSVKVRVAFTDFRGRSAYHCHILDHEDLGMMGVIEVK